MKIAFVTNLCTHYRYKLFKLLAEKYGFDFYFFDDEAKTKEDIKHLTVYGDERFYYLPVREILKKLIKNKYDVIIKCTNNKWSFLGSFIVAKFMRSKFIVWHTVWYYPKTLQYKLFSWLLLKILRNYTDAIVVYGEHGKRFLEEKSISPDKIFIAWQTVDNELYRRDVSEKEIRKLKNNLGIEDNKKVVLYVGRLIGLKGLEYLLEALKIIKRKDFVLLLVGDGNLRGHIEKFCYENKIDYRITGIVPFTQLPPYYKLADVLVLPSVTTKKLKEPWGLVVNEAFNQGCPVVVSDAVGAGIGGLVKDGVNGFVVSERNSEALAETISKILDDEAIKNQMSKNCKEEIKKWTYERQAQGFLEAVEYSIRGLK